MRRSIISREHDDAESLATHEAEISVMDISQARHEALHVGLWLSLSVDEASQCLLTVLIEGHSAFFGRPRPQAYLEVPGASPQIGPRSPFAIIRPRPRLLPDSTSGQPESH